MCPTCRGIGFLMRPATFKGEKALVYPHGTRPNDLKVTCPTCGTEARKRWIAQNSGLEPEERVVKLHRWRAPKLASEEMRGQRVFAKSVIEQAIEDRAGLFTFYGDFGSGKTMALQIAVNEMRELRVTEGYFSTFAGILDHLRRLWSQNADSSDFWQRLLDIPVLAIDEVTRFNEAKEWVREKLFLLVDTRYRRRHSHLTLFATNEDPTQTLPPEESIGYLFSRMREGVLVELRGDVRAALGGT